MEVKFAEYRFMRDQLILYKHDEIIPLKHTQAVLLDFFLADPHGIHSKNTIMDSVWQDKDVSEQVVFQTISQLRAIFGSDSIKTYSKKGYKWEVDIIEQPKTSPEQSILTISKASTHQSKLLIYSIVAAVFLVSVTIFYLIQNSTQKGIVRLHLVQPESASTQSPKNLTISVNQAIAQSDNFSVKITPEKNSLRQSFAAPRLVWKLSKIPNKEWLLWTEIFPDDNGSFLHYGLSNGVVYWQGYVFAKEHQLVTHKLSKRLDELHQLGLFSMLESDIDINTMTKMKKTSPHDPDLLLLFSRHYLQVKQYEVAMTYAQKLANLDTSFSYTPYRAMAQLMMSDIHRQHRNFSLAANSLSNMSDTLTGTSLRPLKHEYFIAKAWVEKERGNVDAMYETLENGLTFSQENIDPLMLFELQINYSILAKKAGDVDKKYAHLMAAQALLLEHKLNESNLAVVYYHFAIFAQDNRKSVPYLEKVLRLPRTKRNYWIIDHATELLIDQYIEQQNFNSAQSLVATLPESPKFLLSRAKLHHATNNNIQARSYYEKAFNLARLEHDGHMGVHAAFGLFQLTAQQPKVQAEYKDYLDRNAKKSWLTEQMNKLNGK